ncbi:hypothetical protein F2P81_006143 [Scophthalmus maximus]|uniref:Uncharacterized protein n=1 Tax=Scophthalmus maximus TaxID=52904 RepID=A0A6A4TIC1_SCOMX|nr:hypothetical protein F2P81_006143 [Scophthalmus maximus]
MFRSVNFQARRTSRLAVSFFVGLHNNTLVSYLCCKYKTRTISQLVLRFRSFLKEKADHVKCEEGNRGATCSFISNDTSRSAPSTPLGGATRIVITISSDVRALCVSFLCLHIFCIGGLIVAEVRPVMFCFVPPCLRFNFPARMSRSVARFVFFLIWIFEHNYNQFDRSLCVSSFVKSSSTVGCFKW